MRILIKAFLQGAIDGAREPFDLSSGMTWADNQDANEWYDRGVNLGQSAGIFAHNIRTLGTFDLSSSNR